MELHPGDKVQLIKNFGVIEWTADAVLLTALKGSIAIVLSYDELCDYLHEILRDDHWSLERLPTWLARKKDLIDEGTHYAIKYETVARPSEEELARLNEKDPSLIYCVHCEVGDVDVLTMEYLEKIAEDNQERTLDKKANKNAA